jgi:polysaccharide export outer membrane protein
MRVDGTVPIERGTRRRIWAVVYVAASFAASPLAAQEGPAAGREAVLMPGDVVRITVWRRPELSGDFAVAADGSIRHPIYQAVKVAGVGIPAAEARLRDFLTRLESTPQFVLEPLFRVTVGGEVRQPNLYSLPQETSVSQAVAMAGGPTERGRLDRVVLQRDGREQVIDLNAPGFSAAHMPVRSGDRIFVARRRDWRDYVVPIASTIAAGAAVVNIFLTRR